MTRKWRWRAAATWRSESKRLCAELQLREPATRQPSGSRLWVICGAFMVLPPCPVHLRSLPTGGRQSSGREEQRATSGNNSTHNHERWRARLRTLSRSVQRAACKKLPDHHRLVYVRHPHPFPDEILEVLEGGHHCQFPGLKRGRHAPIRRFI
jgi:hypothetical protein